ncbi:hypothetical protein K7X08_005190 [Anisodus acutangulus]|uniref:Homeobox domain-containing protein n=1 Tax=Anisodus acutangulus TaxID=402998 RepID=A0A9Q1MGH3_9SOLA|nr:hypothetical protein K7X08_005190 [Anisodus acutangulus]
MLKVPVKKTSVVELTTAQRQELQMKKAKLVSMLDEKELDHQNPTQLALHTISKQFRCLKDAISGQIKATSKTLGEEENFGGKIEGSKLKFVDHHLRQQRALQQLGMVQSNAWRPQRGLPERAVPVLRGWLFQHFLHPYPKDSDKIMLAKQTGLTRSQVSNWFINARVRLWKQIVEECTRKNVPQEKPVCSNFQDASLIEISTSTISTSPMGGDSLPVQATGFSFISSLNMENSADKRNNKKPRNDMQNSSTSTILSVDT